MNTNGIPQNELKMHLQILGWLLIVAHGFFLLVAACIFVLMVGIGTAAENSTVAALASIVGAGVATFIGLLAIPGVVAGAGLLAKKPWSRLLTLIVSGLGLINFPIGTALGVYALWLLLPETAAEFFKGGPA
jgi:hypothetical protein